MLDNQFRRAEIFSSPPLSWILERSGSEPASDARDEKRIEIARARDFPPADFFHSFECDAQLFGDHRGARFSPVAV